jgi:hypothetical protein
MKIPGILLFVIFLLCGLHTCFAQSEEDFIVNGLVRTIAINSQSLKSASESQTETRNYDRTGRMIRKSSANTIKEYYYKDAKDPILTSSYEIKRPMQKFYEIKQYDTRGKLILTAGIDGGEISNLDTYSDQENQINHNGFVRGNEIYSNSKTKKIDLSNMTFSKELVPFIWDKELSEGIDHAYVSYSNPAETDNIAHTITYKIFEKGNPGNRIEIVNATGENEKGYWYRYLNNKIYQERYIANKTDLSDFGHLYDYDKQGRLLSNTYGYFEKIAKGVYMQRREISYDNYGNMFKVRDLAENETSFDINYSYEYDQYKNWTIRVEKYKDGSGSSVTRKLEYYASNESPVTNNLSDADYVALLAKVAEQAKIAERKYKEYLSAKGKPANASIAPVAGTTDWRAFLPAGQVLDTLSYGDLNKDGLEDVVIVFQPKKALQHQRNTTRELRILFKQQDGKYLIAAKSSHA